MLTITLDESDCFAAWVSAKDAGFSSSDGSDPKCKISHLITFSIQLHIQAVTQRWPDFGPRSLQWTWVGCCCRLCSSSGPELASTPWTRKRTRWTMVRRSDKIKPLQRWSGTTSVHSFISLQSASRSDCLLVPSVNGEQENRVQKGNGYFQVPPHTPVIFGEAGGRTLFRYLSSLTKCKLRALPCYLLCNLVILICHVIWNVSWVTDCIWCLVLSASDCYVETQVERPSPCYWTRQSHSGLLI